MKKILTLLTFAAVTEFVSAQDVIVLRSADEIEAKVVSVSDEVISYRRWDNLEGPMYNMDKSKVLFIKYQNGVKDVFTDSRDGVYHSYGRNRTATATNDDFNGVKFQGHVYIGSLFDAVSGGVTLDASVGLRLWKYAYVGVETGFHTLFGTLYNYDSNLDYYSYKMAGAYVPIGVNLKGYIPASVGRRIYSYINCTLGGFIGAIDFAGSNGFYCQVGAGIDIGRFSFGIGYTGLVNDGTGSGGYVKLGVRFGSY